RVADEVPPPPRAQHSGSLRAITARQLQALVRQRHSLREERRGLPSASERRKARWPTTAIDRLRPGISRTRISHPQYGLDVTRRSADATRPPREEWVSSRCCRTSVVLCRRWPCTL